MTTRQFTKIGTQLLPDLPGFAVERDLVIRVPVGDLLHGLCFERRSDPKAFHTWVFFLPLFVPADSVYLNYGDRIGKMPLWRLDNPALLSDLRHVIRTEAMPFLRGVSTLTGALDFLRRRIEAGRPRVNSHSLEALACTLIKVGEYSSALEAVREQKQRLAQSDTPWVVEQCARARLIEAQLLQSPEAALAQLAAWRIETARNLKLQKYLA